LDPTVRPARRRRPHCHHRRRPHRVPLEQLGHERDAPACCRSGPQPWARWYVWLAGCDA